MAAGRASKHFANSLPVEIENTVYTDLGQFTVVLFNQILLCQFEYVVFSVAVQLWSHVYVLLHRRRILVGLVIVSRCWALADLDTD